MSMVMQYRAWDMFGSGRLLEHRVLGVWFYRRSTFQAWSPLLREVTVERGIRFGSRRFGWSKTENQWLDGREPAVTPARG